MYIIRWIILFLFALLVISLATAVLTAFLGILSALGPFLLAGLIIVIWQTRFTNKNKEEDLH